MGDREPYQWVEGGVDISGQFVPVSKPEKLVLVAADGGPITRRDVVSYYLEVGEALLPYLEGRCLTAVRYTRGVEGGGFYIKAAPKDRPDWVSTLPGPGNGGQAYIHVESSATLAWLASIDAFEMHIPLGRAVHPDLALGVMFDLDPGPGADLSTCCQVALLLNDEVDSPLVYKTSGSKGLQVYQPLPTPLPFSETQRYAKSLAEGLANRRPELVVATSTKAARDGKVLIDWLQNMPSKTTVAPYSLRGRNPVGVSAPLTVDEVRHMASSGKLVQFSPVDVLRRLRASGDLYAGGPR
jgi:bifunctional non-homologous end joining protein LigD